MKCELIISSPEQGKSFSLGEGTHIIGRDSKNDIQLLYEHVSRRHAKLEITADKCMIEDLGSSNGTMVNDRKTSRHELHHNDEVKVGNCTFTIQVFQEEKDAHGHFVPRQINDKTYYSTVKMKKVPSFLSFLGRSAGEEKKP